MKDQSDTKSLNTYILQKPRLLNIFLTVPFYTYNIKFYGKMGCSSLIEKHDRFLVVKGLTFFMSSQYVIEFCM